MSSNRINLDNDAFDLQINRSIGPGDYRLCKTFAENINACYSYDGPIGSKADVSVGDDTFVKKGEFMTDIESELSWRNMPLNKTNANNTPINKYKTYNKNMCTNKLQNEDTRFTHPIDNYRGMSLTEYQYEPYLHVNPQCVIQGINEKIGMNSRLYIKDIYVMSDQQPWDKGDAYPKPTSNKQITTICDCKPVY